MYCTSKTCSKQPLKNRQTKVLKTNGSLMKVEKYCRMLPLEHTAMLLICIKQALSDNRSWKTIFIFFLSGRLRQVLLYFFFVFLYEINILYFFLLWNIRELSPFLSWKKSFLPVQEIFGTYNICAKDSYKHPCWHNNGFYYYRPWLIWHQNTSSSNSLNQSYWSTSQNIW